MHLTNATCMPHSGGFLYEYLYINMLSIAVYAVCVLRDGLCYSAPVRGVTMKKASAQSLLQDYLIHYDMSSSISFSNLILNLVLRVSSDTDSE